MDLVRLSDGTCLQDACFYGDGWTVRVDDMGLYMCIKTRQPRIPDSILRRGRAILRSLGTKGTVVDASLSRSAFPPHWKGMRACCVLRVGIDSPIRSDCLYSGIVVRPGSSILALGDPK